MPLFITMHVIVELAGVSECTISYSWNWWAYIAIERFHVTSQSRENRTGGHFGVQLNGDLVCCMMRIQNAVQTWQLMDLPHKYVQYRYPVHVICETWAHWLHSSRLYHTSSCLLVHQDGRHAQKYHGVMQTYIIFHHVMKTLYCLAVSGMASEIAGITNIRCNACCGASLSVPSTYSVVDADVPCWLFCMPV